MVTLGLFQNHQKQSSSTSVQLRPAREKASVSGRYFFLRRLLHWRMPNKRNIFEAYNCNYINNMLMFYK
jgi:hypothetical protein